MTHLFRPILKYEKNWCNFMGFKIPNNDNNIITLTKNLPLFDSIAYSKYPEHNFVYDKLYIAKTQNLKCGLLKDIEFDNIQYPIFIKPRYGHKTETSKNCFKIKNKGQVKKYIKYHDMMWSEYIKDKESMTDFILLNGNIVYQITYDYSQSTNGFVDEYKFISIDNKPPEKVVSWVNNNLKGYTGVVNAQYKGDKIIEVGLRLGKTGSYIKSTQDNALLKNINNVIDHNYWDYNLEKKINPKPFYSFKCFTYMPILFLIPQHMMYFILNKFDCKSYQEYYFEPNGNGGSVFYTFLNDDFKKGMLCKKYLEYLFTLLQLIFIIGIIFSFYLIINKNGSGYSLLFVLFILFLFRFLTPLYANHDCLKIQEFRYFNRKHIENTDDVEKEHVLNQNKFYKRNVNIQNNIYNNFD